MSSLHGKVIVITGASSGIGRAAAVEFARRGGRVVLAARRRAALEETAELCRKQGGEALVVETDITDEPAVRRLVEQALTLTGRIDVWVNNAGVTAFGLLDETPLEEHRRVIETNLFGALYGARAVLPIFRTQRAGVIINVGSILSAIGQPYVPAYVISKFALRGLTETLRSAFSDDRDIHVCSLLPYAVDTPHFESGANHVGFPAHALPPVQSPESVARALANLAERPRRELHVPRAAALGLAAHALFPATVERLVLHITRKWHFDVLEQASTQGNLFGDGTSSAHVRGHRRPRVGLPRVLAWAALHFLRLAAQRGGQTRAASLQPHS